MDLLHYRQHGVVVAGFVPNLPQQLVLAGSGSPQGGPTCHPGDLAYQFQHGLVQAVFQVAPEPVGLPGHVVHRKYRHPVTARGQLGPGGGGRCGAAVGKDAAAQLGEHGGQAGGVQVAFQQVVMGSQAEGLPHQLVFVIARKYHRHRQKGALPQAADQPQPIQQGHFHIGDQQVHGGAL